MNHTIGLIAFEDDNKARKQVESWCQGFCDLLDFGPMDEGRSLDFIFYVDETDEFYVPLSFLLGSHIPSAGSTIECLNLPSIEILEAPLRAKYSERESGEYYIEISVEMDFKEGDLIDDDDSAEELECAGIEP